MNECASVYVHVNVGVLVKREIRENLPKINQKIDAESGDTYGKRAWQGKGALQSCSCSVCAVAC